MPVISRMTTAQAVAETNSRSASELARNPDNRLLSCRSCSRGGEQIAETAHGLDDFDAELLADAADENLDSI